MGCIPFGRVMSVAWGTMRGEDGNNRRRKKRRKRSSYDHAGVNEESTPPVTSTTTKSVVYVTHNPSVFLHPVQDHRVINPSVHDDQPRQTQVRFTLPESRSEDMSGRRSHLPEAAGAAATAPLGGPMMFRYVPSPLPAREQQFGGGAGEYHHYPTPVREGIYRIATESNRITTMFSEENPNACSIV